jgi:hypothetical protein
VADGRRWLTLLPVSDPVPSVVTVGYVRPASSKSFASTMKSGDPTRRNAPSRLGRLRWITEKVSLIPDPQRETTTVTTFVTFAAAALVCVVLASAGDMVAKGLALRHGAGMSRA